MKVALVNPNTSRDTTALMVAIATGAADEPLEIEGVTAAFGSALITDPDALDLAAEAVTTLAPDLAGFDAVIVAAFGDPGLAALRSKLDVPVIGIAEAGMAEAAAGGRRFAVATTTPALAPRIAETAALYRLGSFCGTWTTPGDPATLTADPTGLEAALASAIDRAIREGGAEAVVIGGGPLAEAAKALARTSPVPLVEPIPAAVRRTQHRLGAKVRA